MVLFPHKIGSLSVIAIIIYTLLGFGVVAGITGNLFKSAEKLTEGKDCHTALGIQDVFDKIPVFTFENSCKTIVVDIPESKKGIRKNVQISKLLAKKMVNAWNIVHKGEIPNMWSKGEWAIFFEKSQCMVVYEINLNYIPQGDDSYDMQHLYDYLKLEDYKRVDGVVKTYIEYVQFAGGYGSFSMPELFENVDDTEKKDIGPRLPDPMDPAPKLKEGTVYAISVLSPEKSWTHDNFGWGDQDNTFLAFTTLEYAEKAGCKRK